MKKKYIVSNPKILAGTPVIEGTRIPIAVILSLVKQGYSIKEIHKMYDWVPLRKLEGVIDEVDAMINEKFNEKIF